jgi:tetratricopeptide (TPR) repeat protein
MKRLALSCALILLGTFMCGAQDPTPGISGHLKEIDGLVTHTQDLHKLDHALDLCRRVLKRDPKNKEALVHTCRISWLLGVQLEDEDKAKDLFKLGYEHAQTLKQHYPDQVEGYYWYAVNFGEHINRSSIFAKMGGMGDIMDDAKKSLSIDPKYDSGGAYLIVGRINQLSPGGSDKTAEECFRNALEIAPRRGTAHLYLAELLYDDKKYAEALAEIKQVLEETTNQQFKVERVLNKPHAEEWMQKIEKKLKKKTETRRSR